MHSMIPPSLWLQTDTYDFGRGARMGSFGLVFYGPYQHYWYKYVAACLAVQLLASCALVMAGFRCLAYSALCCS